jgi:putative ABC transport system permease protein
VLQPIMLLALDDLALFGPLRSTKILHGSVDALRQPDGIFLDKYSCEQIWPEEKPELKSPADYARFLGRRCELNEHRVVIVGICQTSANFVTIPVAYTTFAKIRQILPMLPKLTTFVLVKADDRVDLRQLCRSISERTELNAISADDFTWATIWYYITRTGIPFNFGITVVLGFLVGTAIAGQTFYQFTVENLRQFGALKAMGTSDGTILGMILLQSLIVAPIGYGLGVGLATLFGVVTKENAAIAFFMPWQVLAITGVAVFTICVLSSLFSIRRVMVLEPAIVFRG